MLAGNPKPPSSSPGTQPTYATAGNAVATPRPIAATRPPLVLSAYTTSGVIGYPSRANAEKGHMILSHRGRAARKLIALLTDRRLGDQPPSTWAISKSTARGWIPISSDGVKSS